MSKYQEIIDWIQEQVGSGKLGPGDKIPSENELCEQFNMSRQTVRHAIGILTTEGILTAERGSGTYVTDERAGTHERNRIAVVTTYVDSYIFPKMIQGIESKLRELGYSMQIFFTNNSPVREREILQDIIDKDEVAGILLEPTRSALPTPNADLFVKISEMKIPVLFINSYYPGLPQYVGGTEPIPHVSMNDEKCACKAVKFLIQNGHTNIGCILKLDDRQGLDRFSGFQKAMINSRLTVREENTVWIDTRDLTDTELIREKIIKRFSECTAVFCYNDQVASMVINMLQDENISVPKDVSIISMDDSDLAQMGKIQIDSIPHPKERLGERAAENLIRLIHHPNFHASYEFEEHINVKGSVRNLAEKKEEK
ncbi:GntR family transcriptional regulator [Butyrivibrio sp. NC2002]|uniref:GntR family transcriptional regulator n=1 Tax=Butyrivibrio sp. NC2002 TaxID=1410610 RepID=UPI000561A961|nr:GntR family transcriptional regulator [Butyrivibrio sp. NC2002]